MMGRGQTCIQNNSTTIFSTSEANGSCVHASTEGEHASMEASLPEKPTTAAERFKSKITDLIVLFFFPFLFLFLTRSTSKIA